jgi:hypothetical protein
MNFLVRAAQVLVNATWRATHRSKPTEKAIPGAYPVGGHGGWIGLIRESFPGAWQRNVTVSVDTALTYSAVFRCISLISSDIAKMRIKLVRLTDAGVWEETENPAFSPVLRAPNRWQTHNQFFANWLESKLIHGNTYVLKGRDNRVVNSLHVLDPSLVTVLVAPDSSVFRVAYRLSSRPSGADYYRSRKRNHPRQDEHFPPSARGDQPHQRGQPRHRCRHEHSAELGTLFRTRRAARRHPDGTWTHQRGYSASA